MVSAVMGLGLVSSAGLLAGLLLIVLLAIREIVLASAHARTARWIRPLTISLVPLLLVFVVLSMEHLMRLLP